MVTVEEKLDGINIDDTGNKTIDDIDFLRLVFIDEECGNLKAVVDGTAY